ncbi:MAG TPA: hypothetical protein VLW53_12220 [Candidatus Eisenbacteria bacterium]|nr:hypothetical protein [Candidatus Eisenbacteria bacterium]
MGEPVTDGAPDRAVGVATDLLTDGVGETGVAGADVGVGDGVRLAEVVVDVGEPVEPVEVPDGCGRALRAIDAGTGRTSR